MAINNTVISDSNVGVGSFANNATSAYKVDDMAYPSDLLGVSDNGVNPYGMNYVMFYINVQEDSKLLTQGNAPIVPNVTSRVGRDLNGRGYNNAQVVGANVAGSAIAGNVIGSALGISGGGTAGAVLGGVTSSYLSDGSIQDLTSLDAASEAAQRSFSKPLKRLKTAIALHIPNNWNIRYGVQYEDADTFGAQALMAGGAAIVNGATNVAGALMQGNGGGAGQAAINTLKDLGPIAASAGLNATPLGGALSAMSGVASNPKKEQLFKGVDFRTFTFDYQFYPRDDVESGNVKRIIDEFKYHMHPEFKDSGGFLFTYPAEFDIYYYAGGEENQFVHRHSACVLTSMNVNYSPQGQFTSFENGAPTQINITLEFKELAIMTKETLAATGEVVK